MRRKSVQEILAENVAALMKHRHDVRTEKQLRDRAKIGGGTLEGIRKRTKAPTVVTLEKLAHAFDLEPYQLLIPDLDPANPLVARLPPNERQFYEHLKAQVLRLQETVSEYGEDIAE